LLSVPHAEPGAALPVEPVPTNDRRAWSMVLPAAMLTLLAGFRGHFTLFHALLFLVQGLAVLIVRSSPRRAEVVVPNTNDPANQPRPAAVVVRLIFWIGLTLAGTAVAAIGIGLLSSRLPSMTTGMVGALMIAPALVLPMIGSGIALAHRGRSAAILSTGVDCVLLNLCLLLPMTIITWQVRCNWPQNGIAHFDLHQFLAPPATPLPYPMASWRLDTVVLIIFGAALLIFASKRWVPRQVEGTIGVLVFAAYMLANSSFLWK
jgi:hypothetical protein